MTCTIERLLLEHLQQLQAEQAAARDRDVQILSCLARVELGLSRLASPDRTNLRAPNE